MNNEMTCIFVIVDIKLNTLDSFLDGASRE